MVIERQRLLEFDALLTQLLSLKDADFTKFLNSDLNTVIKPFLNCLQAFTATSTSQIDDELSFGLHEKIFKFLLRLCPSKKTEDKPINIKSTNVDSAPRLRPVICPKKFAELLFEADPLGLLAYLYTTWNPSEYLDIIRDELIPSPFIKHLAAKPFDSSDAKVNDFLTWITKGNNSFKGSLKSTEKYWFIMQYCVSNKRILGNQF